MKVNFFIDEHQPEYIDFHVKKLTPAMQSMADELQKQDVLLWGYQEKVVTPLKLDEIIRIKTESTEVHVQDISGTYKVKQRIYQLAELLPDNFIQISSGEIVNFDFIDHLKLSGNGNIVLILKIQFLLYFSYLLPRPFFIKANYQPQRKYNCNCHNKNSMASGWYNRIGFRQKIIFLQIIHH